MSFPLKKVFISKITLLFTLSLLLVTSCSKDENIVSTDEDEITDAMDEETNDPENEPNDDETNSPTTGAVTFESNFTLDESSSVLNYTISQTAYDKFLAGEGDLKMVSEKVYEYLKDDYDFIIILSIEEVKPPDLFYGRSTLVQNAVEGLGGNTYNNASNYGSDGRLQSIIYMPRSEYVRAGPFLHEIAHTWGNKGFIPTTVGGHWGFSSAAGQLGGFEELTELGNGQYSGRIKNKDNFGTFANGGNSIPYGNLELYLMGLIGVDELETVKVAVNPEWGQNPGEFTADEMQSYSAEELVAEHGSRLPAVADAQKDFKAVTVIISTEKLEAAKTNAIKVELENFSRSSAPDGNWGNTNNFWMATQGKASFDFTIKQASVK